MPKIIEGLRENMLSQSRHILFTEGYDAVTIRRVASLCGVAVGTVYNYYSSKNLLIASVMLEDWHAAVEQMRSNANTVKSILDGLHCMFDRLVEFRKTYSRAWGQYSAGGGDLSMLEQRHIQLVEQLSGIIAAMAEHVGLHPEAICTEIAAEVLLSRSQRDTAFDPIAPALIKLLI